MKETETGPVPASVAPSPTPTPTPSPKEAGVTYRVEGTAASSSVTYINDQGGTQQDKVSVPWEKAYPDMGVAKFAYLSAQNDGDSGSVTCKILHDGKEWKVSTSTAPYGIASCSGTVGF